jgi:hypothetical protein
LVVSVKCVVATSVPVLVVLTVVAMARGVLVPLERPVTSLRPRRSRMRRNKHLRFQISTPLLGPPVCLS